MTTSLTNFDFDFVITDKSDKTVEISNTHFLQAIFGDPSNYNEHPIIVSFKGSITHKSNWAGKPWMTLNTNELAPDANNYFSLARFRSDEQGKYKRKKSQFHGLYAIMLDDIGTKVSRDRIILDPSWALETSPNNFQVGYILEEPINDSKLADKLMETIVHAGLCDPGASGPTARLARLPMAINGKYKPSFQCQLRLFKPDNRYSVQELLDAISWN